MALRNHPPPEQVLADWQRVLGKDHTDAMVSRNYLAYACSPAGDLDRGHPAV
jgi:hypothetical protein